MPDPVPPPTSFASVELLATRLGFTGTLSDDETARFQSLLDGATAMIQAYAGQHLWHVTDDVVRVRGAGVRGLLLPETPVTAVSKVQIVDGDELDDWTWTTSGVVQRPIPWPSVDVEVTYSHGWATIPAPLVEVCLAVAARAVERQVPAGMGADTPRAAGVALWREERRIVAAYGAGGRL